MNQIKSDYTRKTKASISMVYVFFMSIIIIIALIFVFVKFLPLILSNEQANFNECANHLQSAFNDVSSLGYGSSISFGVGSTSPIFCSGFKEICFISTHDVTKLSGLNSNSNMAHRELYNDIKSGSKSNIYLIDNKNDVKSLGQKINNNFTTLPPYNWTCIRINGGIIKIKIKDAGNSFLVSNISN